MADPNTQRHAGVFLLASVLLTVLLYIVPYGHTIGYPLMLVSTLAHELGHGVAAWLVGGSFHSLEIWSDGSGAALTGGYGGRLARALVAAGGLCGPAVGAAFGFTLAGRARASRLGLGALSIVLGLAMLLVVRNLFGLLFVGLLAAGLALVALRANAWASQLTLLFLSVQLALSVFSRGDYLFTPAARTGMGAMPSDAANIASALFLPYWFWGLLCGIFSVLVLAVGAWIFLRSLATPISAASCASRWRRSPPAGPGTGR